MKDKKSQVPVFSIGFKERMTSIIDRLGGLRAASTLVGVTEDSLSNWKSGRVNPSFHGMKSLAKAADVSLDWLAYGEGPERLEDTGNYVLVSCIDAASLAETTLATMLANEPQTIAMPRSWVAHTLGLTSDNLVLLTASGDTMVPTISSGDILLVDVDINKFTEEAVYLVGMGDTVSLKRVQMAPGGSITLKNDNQAYEDQSLAPEDIQKVHVFGVVRWISRPY